MNSTLEHCYESPIRRGHSLNTSVSSSLNSTCQSLFNSAESVIDSDTSESIKGVNGNMTWVACSSWVTSPENISVSHNMALSESVLMDQLCNCLEVKHEWCFIHNTVAHNQPLSTNKNNDFGFINHVAIPTPLVLPPCTIEVSNLLQWAFDAHRIVSATNCPNYKGARIRVPTELNINDWRALCANYEDQLLLDYLEYGFPLCVDRNKAVFNTEVVNHPSAIQFPDDIDTYFRTEISHKAIVGPCKHVPFPVHYSPILSRPKVGDSRRVIVNLSSPYGSSVNDCIANDVYDGIPYTLKYPSVDDIVNGIQDLEGDVLLSKIDVSRAFRNLRVDPGDFDLLGLKWRDNSYLDISIPMGMKSGSALCQRTTDVIRHIMASKNVKIYNYIDDVICMHRRHNADAEFDVLHSLFEFLGIPINPKKVSPPTRSLTCMGISIDVDNRCLTIPQEKILETLDLCRLYLTKKFITKKQLQSLLGKLLYIHRCVAPARIFVNRLLNVLRSATGRIKLCNETKKDLNWFVQFLCHFNGTVLFEEAKPKLEVFLDACLTGLGAYWEDNAYAVSRNFQATRGLSITQLEMLNVLIALRIFGDKWDNLKIKMRLDNRAAVCALGKGRIRDPFMQAVARSVWLIAASKGISLVYEHIAGTDNCIADALSRAFDGNGDSLEKFKHFVWWPVDGMSFYPNTFV